MLKVNQLIGFGSRPKTPNIVLAGTVEDGTDRSSYTFNFTLSRPAADRHIIVLFSTGANSGTRTLVSHTIGGSAGVGVNVEDGKTVNFIAYKKDPTATSITMVANLSNTMSGAIAACFEVWDLHPAPIIQTRSGEGTLNVKKHGFLFAAAAGDNEFTFTSMTQLEEQPGSDVNRELAYVDDFPTEQDFDIQVTDPTAPFSLAALSIR